MFHYFQTKICPSGQNVSIHLRCILLSVIFVNDSYLQGNIEKECPENMEFTVDLPIKLSFKINEQKLILKPT